MEVHMPSGGKALEAPSDAGEEEHEIQFPCCVVAQRITGKEMKKQN
jgi:hypothetical protein